MVVCLCNERRRMLNQNAVQPNSTTAQESFSINASPSRHTPQTPQHNTPCYKYSQIPSRAATQQLHADPGLLWRWHCVRRSTRLLLEWPLQHSHQLVHL